MNIDDRPTSYCGKLQMAVSWQQVTLSTSLYGTIHHCWHRGKMWRLIAQGMIA